METEDFFITEFVEKVSDLFFIIDGEQFVLIGIPVLV
jgi:hypothetical protein